MKNVGLVAALSLIGRRFIGGYRGRAYGGRSKHEPHIGEKQKRKYSAMRDGHMDAANRKRAGEDA